jgi:uncharacterized phage-like protein YoqJ
MKWFTYTALDGTHFFGELTGLTEHGHFCITDYSRGYPVPLKIAKRFKTRFTFYDVKPPGFPPTGDAVEAQIVTPDAGKPPLVVGITGHRPDKLGGWRTPNPTYLSVLDHLKQALEHYRPDFVISGMALGVDQWAAELCLTLGIRFIAAVPFKGQESKWPPQAKAKYDWLVSRAHQVCVISEGGYSPQKMFLRDKWIVDYSHVMVAVWNGSDGGTAHTVSYAKQVGKPIYFVPCDPPQVQYTNSPTIMQVIEGAKPQAVLEEEKAEAAEAFKRKVILE